MTNINDLEGHCDCLKPFSSYSSGYITHMCVYMTESICGFSSQLFVKIKRLFRDTSSHVRCETGAIMVQVKDFLNAIQRIFVQHFAIDNARRVVSRQQLSFL